MLYRFLLWWPCSVCLVVEKTGEHYIQVFLLCRNHRISNLWQEYLQASTVSEIQRCEAVLKSPWNEKLSQETLIKPQNYHHHSHCQWRCLMTGFITIIIYITIIIDIVRTTFSRTFNLPCCNVHACVSAWFVRPHYLFSWNFPWQRFRISETWKKKNAITTLKFSQTTKGAE